MATGAQANLLWGLETTFGTAATNINKAFGAAVEITSLEWDNQENQNRGLGSRNLQAENWSMGSGKMGLKFDLLEPFIFRVMAGGYAKSGTGTLTYTFAEADVLPSFTIADYIHNIDGGSDTLLTFVGCVVTDYTLDIAKGTDPITITLNVQFADCTPGTAAQTPIFPAYSVLTFAQAQWVKGSTTMARTEEWHLKVDQGVELKPYLGSRIAQRARYGDRKYEMTCNNYYQDPTSYLNDAFGGSSGPTQQGPNAWNGTLSITPSGTMTGATYTITLTGNYITKHSLPQKEGEDIIEQVTATVTSVNVQAVTAEAEIEW